MYDLLKSFYKKNNIIKKVVDENIIFADICC
jgi:hypothetical protein